MSNKAKKCTCSAFFAKSRLLDDHIDEFRTQENHHSAQLEYHSAQLEKCRSHSRIDNVDDPNAPIHTLKICPHKDCTNPKMLNKPNKPNKQFQTNFKLQRHFETHIECEEYCVFCGKSATLVSEFRRHAENHHQDGTGSRAIFMQSRQLELGHLAMKELSIAKAAYLSEIGDGRNQKRPWDVAGMDDTTSNAKRPKGVGVLTTESSRSLTGIVHPSTDVNRDANAPLPAAHMVQGFASAPITAPTDMLGFNNTSIQLADLDLVGETVQPLGPSDPYHNVLSSHLLETVNTYRKHDWDEWLQPVSYEQC